MECVYYVFMKISEDLVDDIELISYLLSLSWGHMGSSVLPSRCR